MSHEMGKVINVLHLLNGPIPILHRFIKRHLMYATQTSPCGDGKYNPIYLFSLILPTLYLYNISNMIQLILSMKKY